MSRRALRSGGAGPSSTLAVLPFKPLAAEARDELLEVGMADSLIARLSTVPGLVVRSVGSVRRYAGTEQDPLRAARELDVAWIVDGSLQRRGDQLRVTARLLRSSRRRRRLDRHLRREVHRRLRSAGRDLGARREGARAEP